MRNQWWTIVEHGDEPLFVFLARQPPLGQGLLIHEVSRSHTTTHYSRQDSSGRVMSSSQRPPSENTQHTTLTTHNTHNTTLTTHNTHNTQHSQHTKHDTNNTQHSQHTTRTTHNTHNTQHSQHTKQHSQHTIHNTHNTQHSQHTTNNTHNTQQTNIHTPGGIRTHDLSRRAAADLCLRPRGHWDWLDEPLPFVNWRTFIGMNDADSCICC